LETKNQVYWQLYVWGYYRELIPLHNKRLFIAREIGDRQAEGIALGILGIAYDSLGNYSEAIEYYQQYLAIAREIGDRRGEGITLGNLGITYDSLGNYSEALEYHQQHLAIAREIGDRSRSSTANQTAIAVPESTLRGDRFPNQQSENRRQTELVQVLPQRLLERV
jgi:tetratricopeptide (TPR) repeat protein